MGQIQQYGAKAVNAGLGVCKALYRHPVKTAFGFFAITGVADLVSIWGTAQGYFSQMTAWLGEGWFAAAVFSPWFRLAFALLGVLALFRIGDLTAKQNAEDQSHDRKVRKSISEEITSQFATEFEKIHTELAYSKLTALHAGLTAWAEQGEKGLHLLRTHRGQAMESYAAGVGPFTADEVRGHVARGLAECAGLMMVQSEMIGLPNPSAHIDTQLAAGVNNAAGLFDKVASVDFNRAVGEKYSAIDRAIDDFARRLREINNQSATVAAQISRLAEEEMHGR